MTGKTIFIGFAFFAVEIELPFDFC